MVSRIGSLLLIFSFIFLDGYANELATSTQCGRDGYCYDSINMFVGLVWKNKTKYANLDLIPIQHSLFTYIQDIHDLTTISKINILFVSTNGIFYNCTDVNLCINYVASDKFFNDVISESFNPDDSIYTHYNNFFTEHHSNSSLNIAYLYVTMFECYNFSDSNFLTMLVDNNKNKNMIGTIISNRIYNYFMIALSTIRSDQACWLTTILEQAGDYFQTIITELLDFPFNFPKFTLTDFSVIKDIYTEDRECKYLGTQKDISAPHCQTSDFNFIIALDYYKTSSEGFEEFKEFVFSLMKSCTEMSININLFTTAKEPYNVITCAPYNDCHQQISGLTIDQLTSKDSQTFAYNTSKGIMEAFYPAINFDTRAYYFLTNVDCDQIPNVNFSIFHQYEYESYYFGVLMKEFKMIFSTVMFNQSSKKAPHCESYFDPMSSNGKEFIQLHTLKEGEKLLGLTDSLFLTCHNTIKRTKAEAWQYVLFGIVLIIIILITAYLFYRFLLSRRQQKIIQPDQSIDSEQSDEKNERHGKFSVISNFTRTTNAYSFSQSSSVVLPPIDLTETNPENNELIEFLKRIAEMEYINVLSFPGQDAKTYKFNIMDFNDKGILETTTHNIIRKFEHAPSGQFMAIKFLLIPQTKYIDRDNEKRLKNLINELDNYKALWECPEIVDCYGYCNFEGYMMLCMELMDMSLKELYLSVHHKNQVFPENLVGYIFVKIVNAMAFCKEKEIMHRDIKPTNILINKTGEIKLCDFGESRILTDSFVTTRVGTIAYWPPEHFKNDHTPYDIRFDIWSLGITLMEVILGRLPYFSKENSQPYNHIPIITKILNNDFEDIINVEIKNLGYSNKLCEILTLICAQEVDERPKLGCLQNSDFYRLYSDFSTIAISQLINTCSL